MDNGVFDRPNAEVGILIDQDHVNLLPTVGDGMDCQDNQVWIRLCPRGSHPRIRCKKVVLLTVTAKLRSAKFLTTVINGKKMNHVKRVGYPEFLKVEELAIEIPRRCERCAGCKRCSYQSQEMSRKEQEEYRLLKDVTTADLKNKSVRTSYPIIGDITKMKDNRGQAVRRAEVLEKSPKRKGLTESYNNVFQEYVDRGVLQEVSTEEIEKWKQGGGYIH